MYNCYMQSFGEIKHGKAFEGIPSKPRIPRVRDGRTPFSPVKGRSCQLPKKTIEGSVYIVGRTRGEDRVPYCRGHCLLSCILCNAFLRISPESWMLWDRDSSFAPYALCCAPG